MQNQPPPHQPFPRNYPPYVPQQPPPQWQPPGSPGLPPLSRPPARAPKPARKKPPRGCVVAAIVMTILLLAVVVIAIATSGSGSGGTPTPTVAAQHQTKPTANATATFQAEVTAVASITPVQTTTTSGLPATHGTPQLGGQLSDFVGAYGQPAIISAGASYDFRNHTISVLTSGSQVIGIIASPAGDSATWSNTEAKDACLAFVSSDATYKRHISYPASSDEAYIYVSAALATYFPASTFTDENGNAATPGTFTVELTYASNSTDQFDQCSLDTGVPSL